MQVISFINQKGGVGKTTSTLNVAAGLQKLGKKVLLVDLDHQANLTYSLGVEADDLEKTIYNVFKDQTPLSEIILEVKGFHLIPSSIDLSGIDLELAATPGRENFLKRSISKLNSGQFDFLLVDCPPSLGLLLFNALVATDSIIIPAQSQFLALKGMKKLLDTIELVKDRLGVQPKILGILGTLYRKQTTLGKNVIQTLQDHFGDLVFETIIRENVALAEAPSYGQDIFTYKPDSPGSADYLKLSKEILERSEK